MSKSVEVGGREERRIAILEATWQLVAERGYHNVRVQDVARICGTSTGTVHYYFPGKVDVLREALRYCVDQAFERQGASLRSIDNARKRLLALIEMQLPIGNQVREEWSVWLQFWSETCIDPELRTIHNDFYARWMDTVVRIVVRGQRQGIFRDVDAAQFASLLTSATDGAAIKVLTGVPGMTVDVMRNMLVSIVDKELGLTA
ncbi:TetR/AcrR family transcriptional regulator [Cryobacterium tagatosivorans]|uniref:TetR family transcriptional regulator n=1 Tax=Cryobacterium tagatosivorans TaxID=1259199 RepID=A0A4R8UBG9_9MICO|nr:TetR/AcrR family transcriptional regulator [Cryobacterium tagatosivorans]TFB48339.1 TetR family transcriptional regulator [Cryobacterium tagatosivorans]